MKKIICLLYAVFTVFLCGCGNDYETQGEAIAAKLTAAQMVDIATYNKVSSQRYAPGLAEMYAIEFENFCIQSGVPMDKPILELLKNGFPNVETKVEHKVIAESNNPFVKSDVVYSIVYKIDATDNPDVPYLLEITFMVYETPEGTAVIQLGGYEELNGKRSMFSTPEQVIRRVGSVSKGVNDMLKFFSVRLKKKVKNKS